MPTKIYISGKISGLPENEAMQKFQEAEDYLKQTYPKAEIVNPFKIDHPHDKSWENYMRYDLIEMLKCDSIFMLENWIESKGAKIEHDLAKKLKFNIIMHYSIWATY